MKYLFHANPLAEVMIEAAYHELGIAPIKDAGHNFNKILEGLNPEDARKMKRKFRKIWRKCAKNKKLPSAYTNQLGIGSDNPTKIQMRNRKREVSRHIIAERVMPLVSSFQEKGK
jgi:hypothetical protein